VNINYNNFYSDYIVSIMCSQVLNFRTLHRVLLFQIGLLKFKGNILICNYKIVVINSKFLKSYERKIHDIFKQEAFLSFSLMYKF
jgi:hypothetical protein